MPGIDETAVLTWTLAGYSIFPVGPRKEPADSRWTGGAGSLAQTQPATADEARDMARRYDGIAAAAGAASGHAEMFEIEGKAVAEGYADRLRQVMRDHDREEILDRLLAGCVVRSPSGGYHIWFRTEGPALGNRKLARRPLRAQEEAMLRASLAEHGRTEPEIERIVARSYETLIETRGQGGYAVVPPSGGSVHPNGGAWVLLPGTSPTQTPIISIDERDFLYGMAGLLDEIPPPPEPSAPQPIGPGQSRDGKRPGDDFEDRATWEEILEPAGWRKIKTLHGGGQRWVRPGKDANEGISGAVVELRIGWRFVPYSSSTLLEPFKPLSKYALYAHLEHDGNYANAARALRLAGYGEPLASRTPPASPRTPAGERRSEPPPRTEGNLALVTELRPRAAEQWLATDDSNALGLVEGYGDRIRYCTDKGRWLAWDGTRWEWQASTGGAAREYAKTYARDLPEAEKHESAWKKRSLSSAGTTAMLVQAATDPRLTVTMNELDAHPWELNTPAGIVDLRTGQLLPSDPAKLHTRVTGCAPDPAADPAAWLGFLEDTFDSPDLITYLRRLVGYSAVGVVGPHVLPFCHGSGGNGKGVFLEVLVKILGDYATTAPSGFLMASAHASHETEIARLAGARMVLCSEVNEDDRFDEAKVKQLTGGDTLTARFMRQDHFTFTATHQLWLMGNHKPAVRSGGRSFWRRLRLVPFEHEVPEDEVVDDLQGILAREHGPAILAWIIAGAAEYAEGGLREPESVKAATADYAHDQDTVGRFVEECCRVGGGEHVTIKIGIVRSAYERWCLAEGEQSVTAKAFGQALARRFGVESKRTKQARLYVGLALENVSPGDASEDASPPEDDHWSSRGDR